MPDDGFEVIVNETPVEIVTEDGDVQVFVTEDVVSVVSVGIQGPPGPGQTTYTHTQNISSDTWVIQHNLGRHPSVVVIDSAGSVIISDVQYDSEYQVTVRFSAGFSGKAYLN
jgi:hypothetical protein